MRQDNLDTSRIVRGVENPRVSKKGMKMLFKVVLGVKGWNTSRMERIEEKNPVDDGGT